MSKAQNSGKRNRRVWFGGKLPGPAVCVKILVVCAGLAAFAGVSLAQDDVPSSESQVLHEYFDPATAFIPGAGAENVGAMGRDPTSDVVHSGVRLPSPPSESGASDEEARYSPDGASSATGRGLPEQNGPRNPNRGEIGLDDDTDREGTLNYITVFNPSVVPFKRAGVMDTLVVEGDQPRLTLGDANRRSVPIRNGKVDPNRDRFWGSLVVEATPGEAIPIPSVAPGARILKVETNPEASAEFFVDGADNMFVVLDYNGEVRLNFLTDADPGYFGMASIPGNVRMKDIGDFRTAPRLPRELRGTVADIADMVGVSRRDEIGEALPKMVAYFRDFASEPLPRDARTGDILMDIARERRGVCRHRSFAFIAVAHYLGMPARYVYNEAHAFVEVFVPLRGWLRIDLGGGAEGLQVGNSENKIRHEPRQRTDLPTPERYENEYSAVSGADGESMSGFENIEGMPPHPSEITETTDDPAAPAPAEEQGDGTASARSGTGTQGSDPGRNADPGVDPDAQMDPGSQAMSQMPASPADPSNGSDAADDPGTMPTPGSPVSARTGTRIELDSVPRSGLRGDSVTLRGRLLATDDTPLANQEVHVVLEPLDSTAGQRTALATISTDAAGGFEANVSLPQTLPVGRWDLYVVFSGSEDYIESRSL